LHSVTTTATAISLYITYCVPSIRFGSFFQFLDETIGAGNYAVAVSADHGAQNVVEYELEQGRPYRGAIVFAEAVFAEANS